MSCRCHRPARAADCQRAAREAVCTKILIQQLTAEKSPQTEQQQSIKVCWPMPFEPQSHNTLVFHPAMFEQRLCLHRAVLTESEGPTEKEKRGAPLIKD